MKDVTRLPAIELATLIQHKQISSVELLQAFLRNIAQDNAKINAIVTLNEKAMEQAKACDQLLSEGKVLGPLHGVPITIKDCFLTQGLKTTVGFNRFKAYIPERDAPTVARLKQAGAIIIGKTNTPCLAADVQTNNPIFGRTNNPWNLSLGVGGSSGGSAAAIAAGFTPLCLGSDIGGSLRIPAHACGITALKPTTRLVSIIGHIPPLPEHDGFERILKTPGPMASCVADLRLALEVIAGAEKNTAEFPEPSLQTSSKKVNLAELRLAYCSTFADLPLESQYRSTYEEFIATLNQTAATLDKSFPSDFELIKVWKCFGQILGAELSISKKLITAQGLAMSLRSLEGKDYIARHALRGLTSGIKSLLSNLRRRDHFIMALEAFFENYDALICPVMCLSAFPHQTSGKPFLINGEKISYLTATLAYTTPFNLTGHPVVTLPIGITKDNIPVGVQIITKRWHDMRLLDIAEQIEKLLDFKSLDVS